MEKKYNRSETSFCRERLLKYCSGSGLDIGYGGDPIVPSAITVDKTVSNLSTGGHPLNLEGDAANLYWFRDGVMDYVYSSHLLEDFNRTMTRQVILEWLRVLKIRGYLILYLPNEQRFRRHCERTGQPYNASHSIEDFSLEYLKGVLRDMPNIKVVHEDPACEEYSFEIVVEKTGVTLSEKGSAGIINRFLKAMKRVMR
ncbi:MAG: methyltransferase domain-containing protein [Deltaproteobacteria bacterium]|nr:methyltransferase domain-containing protein [Deltaproteobacteria bacterium]